MRYARVGVGLAALFGVGVLANHELDVWSNHWAYAAPPLLDRWVGETMTAAGTRLDLVLTLRRDDPPDLVPISDNSDSGDRDIDGEALLCDSTGHRAAYKVGGFVRDAMGHAALLTLADRGPRTPGLGLARLELAWDLKDGLIVSGAMMRDTPTGAILSSSDRDIKRPARFVMRRARGAKTPCD